MKISDGLRNVEFLRVKYQSMKVKDENWFFKTVTLDEKIAD